MIIGEQPGDEEDLAGKPFVGPSGKFLSRLLADAGLERDALYVTNAVKHFKWRSGYGSKKRLHQRPTTGEIGICRAWLGRELSLIRPQIIVCLGSSAATAIFGRAVKIKDHIHRIDRDLAGLPAIIVTYHPSAALRAITSEQRHSMEKEIVSALRLAKKEFDRLKRAGMLRKKE
jgi:DNA polymerase